MKLSLVLAFGLLAAAPALANRELQGATCGTGTVCQLSTSLTDCQTGYFCDAACNMGSGNSGLCNQCPTAFTTALNDAKTSGSWNSFNTAYPGCEAVPEGADPQCITRTCIFVAGTRKVPGRYECRFAPTQVATPCDDGDKCNGTSDVCGLAADGITAICKPGGTPVTCASQNGACTQPLSGKCDPKSGTCSWAPLTGTDNSCCDGTALKKGTVCRPASDGGCNPEEVCDGVNPGCPADDIAPNYSKCDDGKSGNCFDICLSGKCASFVSTTGTTTPEMCTGTEATIAPACGK